MAMKEDKAQSKQAEDEGVFFRFGDEGAVDSDLYGSLRRRRKIGVRRGAVVSSRKEVTDGFVDDACARPI